MVPVTNAVTVQITLTLFANNPNWITEVIDIKAAFLQGQFVDNEQMYIKIPDGFKKFYNKDNGCTEVECSNLWN